MADVVDPKETVTRAGLSVAGASPPERKVWIKPRLETAWLSDAEATPGPPGTDGSGSIS
jgi:hypothetical protein